MVMTRCYDHCSPSVIAFADAEDALAFTKRHGGKIISFQTLLDEAKNP
jgi:nitrous oxide reductase accessory protein NosL